jgi:uncharacterized protein YndB with AHSA1/START domain
MGSEQRASNMHFEASVVAKVPRAKAYAAYTDFEAIPRWSREKGEVRVSRTEENKVYLGRGSSGRRLFKEMKLFPPERVESEGETRFTRTKSVVRFEEVPAGTRVTASLDVQLKGHWSWILKTQGKLEAESSAREELNLFARYVEGLP